MITTNVSGTTTILAILLNTTNAHASMGVSSWQPSLLAVRFLLWLFRDVPKTLRLFSAMFISRCEDTKNILQHQIYSLNFNFPSCSMMSLSKSWLSLNIF